MYRDSSHPARGVFQGYMSIWKRLASEVAAEVSFQYLHMMSRHDE
jgi:hypothetical protein